MKSIAFKDETGDTIEVGFSYSEAFVTITEGEGIVYISVESIDKLIQALQELKGEINE
jgi:hypothetical protein